MDSQQVRKSWLELGGDKVQISVSEDLKLSIYDAAGELAWETSRLLVPKMLIIPAGWVDRPVFTVAIGQAGEKCLDDFKDGNHIGHKIKLGSYENTDVELELVLAIDKATDELLVQVEQSGGQDRVRQIEHFYRVEKPTSSGGYMIVPLGSGYLIPADSSDAFKDEGIVGGAFSLPLFGMVKDHHTMYQIVETFWDAYATVEHVPQKECSIDFTWLSSLGSLRYARRFVIRFAEEMSYVDIAKAYRRRIQDQDMLITLEDRAKTNFNIRKYIEGVEFRWHTRQAGKEEEVLDNIRKLQDYGLAINFFLPKWPDITDGGWHSFLNPSPEPGSWEALKKYADSARTLGCLIKMFILCGDLPAFDPEKKLTDEAGNSIDSPFFGISDYFARELLRDVLDSLQAKGITIDALYFDGYCAHNGRREDFSPKHRTTRSKSMQNVIACFKETRRRGIMPGAELARFWSVPYCDFYFFSDWASDRLREGTPIPLFQLVFHDCYIAHFSGGGYGSGTDWWPDRNPRLYELLFAAAPSYNWLPEGGLYGKVPIEDCDSDSVKEQLEWLRRWSTYYQAVAYSEMVAHEFLNADRSLQRVEFANRVNVEFDMNKNVFRIKGVKGFTGDWEEVPEF